MLFSRERTGTASLATVQTTPAAMPPDAYSLRLVAARTLYDAGRIVSSSPSLAAMATSAHHRCLSDAFMTFTLFPESLLRESYSHKDVTVKNQE